MCPGGLVVWYSLCMRRLKLVGREIEARNAIGYAVVFSSLNNDDPHALRYVEITYICLHMYMYVGVNQVPTYVGLTLLVLGLESKGAKI
jgi:hypothetical protein